MTQSSRVITPGGGVPPADTNKTLVSGQKTVTTAGTAVLLLAANTPTRTVIIKALASNTGDIYVGNVSDDVSSSNGLVLDAGEGVSFDIDNSSTAIYIDSGVNGEGVSFIYLV